jgi:hypothetical protein
MAHNFTFKIAAQAPPSPKSLRPFATVEVA